MQRTQQNNQFFFIILLLFTTALLTPSYCRAAKKLLVMYSNDIRGELEACG
jgi:hypothetical protein